MTVEYRFWLLYSKRMATWEEARNNLVRDMFDPGSVVPMSYTGEKDRHGKKIFEGDILRGRFNFHGVHPETIVVKIPEIFFLMEGGGCFLNECDIIGNFFENPDLVKELNTFGYR